MLSSLKNTHAHTNHHRWRRQEVVKTISKGRGRKGAPNLASQDQNVAMRNPPKCGIETGLEMGWVGAQMSSASGSEGENQTLVREYRCSVSRLFFLPRISLRPHARLRRSVILSCPPISLLLPKHYNSQETRIQRFLVLFLRIGLRARGDVRKAWVCPLTVGFLSAQQSS